MKQQAQGESLVIQYAEAESERLGADIPLRRGQGWEKQHGPLQGHLLSSAAVSIVSARRR